MRRRFDGLASSVEVRPRTLDFESDSVASLVEFWEKTNAPLAALKSMQPRVTYQQVLTEMAALIEELNESGDGHVKLSSPYIVVLARKAA